MDDALALLARSRAYRVTEVWRPRDPDDLRAGHRSRAQRAALTATYHAGIVGPAGGTVAFGWVRTEAGGPVHVLTVGEALAGSADAGAGEVLLSLPCGARGTALRPAELAWLTGRLACWREAAGISDPLLAAGGQGGQLPAFPLLRRPPGGAGGAAGHAVELFAGLLAEVRAYGEGLVIAEQIPGRLVPDVIKNTAVKIIHRLPAADDREAVGAAINATEAQSRYLVTLRPGQAAAFADGMDFPVLVQVKDGTRRERAEPAASGPGALVRPRSAACGTECAGRPCTLREMRRAQQALEDEPWTGLWAGLAVLGHLAGWPAPVPQPDVLATLQALPARTGQCAISHAVDAAVFAQPRIRRPAALAAHVLASLRARAEHGEWFCSTGEPEWLLPAMAIGDLPKGLLQGIEKDQGASPGSLASFIACEWPLQYLAAGRPPG